MTGKRNLTPVYNPPIRFRPWPSDRRAPIAHHLPAGPPPHNWPDDDTLLRSAEERAWADVEAATHDVLSLTSTGLMHFEHENAAERQRDQAWIDQLEIADLTMGASIAARADERAATAAAALGATVPALEEVDTQLEDSRAELLGEGRYTDSVWRAPERVGEAVWQTALRRWSVFLVLLPAELGINMLALQLLRGGVLERASFALVVGVATVWAGHAAGTWMAVHRRAKASVRMSVPIALAVLAVAVTVLIAALRVAYVNHSDVDPATGLPAPSALSAAGIPGPLLWLGVAAVQLIFFTIAVLHTAHSHNPRMQVLQASRLRRKRLLRRQARYTRRWNAATRYAEFAAAHRARAIELWAAKRDERNALFDQRWAVYLGAFARGLGNPDATVALQARLDREHRLRTPSRDRRPQPRVARPDATRPDDTDRPSKTA